MISATYLRYIVERIRHLFYSKSLASSNKSLIVPLLSAEQPFASSSSSAPASSVATNANPLFWKEEEQRQRNQEAEVAYKN
jgi:hypothetical protein